VTTGLLSCTEYDLRAEVPIPTQCSRRVERNYKAMAVRGANVCQCVPAARDAIQLHPNTGQIWWKRGRVETTVEYTSETFSKKSKNKLFFWFAVPLVYLDDIVMVFSVVLILLLYVYSVEIVNYSFLYVLMAMTSFIYLLVFVGDDHDRNIKNMIIIPLVFFLSHLSMVIEVSALIIAYWTVITRRKVEWQKWQRRGVVDKLRQK